MITYNELYEILRKEKYSDVLQPIPRNFLSEFSEYIKENTFDYTKSDEVDILSKSKKQFENSLSLFRELILKRKKKILNLIFVATETGIMKRDYENMLDVEKEAFEKMVRAFEECDKELSKMLHNKENKKEANKMILFKQSVDQFIDSSGSPIGPYKQGELVNMD